MLPIDTQLQEMVMNFLHVAYKAQYIAALKYTKQDLEVWREFVTFVVSYICTERFMSVQLPDQTPLSGEGIRYTQKDRKDRQPNPDLDTHWTERYIRQNRFSCQSESRS